MKIVRLNLVVMICCLALIQSRILWSQTVSGRVDAGVGGVAVSSGVGAVSSQSRVKAGAAHSFAGGSAFSAGRSGSAFEPGEMSGGNRGPLSARNGGFHPHDHGLSRNASGFSGAHRSSLLPRAGAGAPAGAGLRGVASPFSGEGGGGAEAGTFPDSTRGTGWPSPAANPGTHLLSFHPGLPGGMPGFGERQLNPSYAVSIGAPRFQKSPLRGGLYPGANLQSFGRLPGAGSNINSRLKKNVLQDPLANDNSGLSRGSQPR